MDYIINGAGAKVYKDPKKIKQLEIPFLKSTSEDGSIYNVLSAGFIETYPLVTIENEKGEPEVRLLPNDLTGWVLTTMDLKKRGISLLPEKVEFGNINGVSYAEIN
ncbi:MULTISPECIES: hypothetical protein [Bacillus subtilis group]|uniref:hypothetical protein n=1 Tax=Bacillus subtilis group TaxID=653685 RepID=UPI000B449BCA|nr:MULTISPECIES: hypothetical protein [Bacillus subtilis group]OTQ84950.1 hypothetical protein BG30_12390 [Bacillus subtilis subsp. subtilis]MCB7160042.1 hypothetical protein [Bacillus subtilis]MCB7458960.1 hypothetical protein [Bacillus subtilis]MED1677508.1 hypothetical protein [Bacillus subtilis]QVN25823.1 hypothetical protein JYG31_11350 [Bacillus halotolerans]